MLERIHGDIHFECNTCPEVLDTETGNFEAARNLLRREGWTISKVGSDWIHACPGCSTARTSLNRRT